VVTDMQAQTMLLYVRRFYKLTSVST